MQRIPDVKFTVFSLEKCDRIKKSEEFDRARQQLTCGNIPYDSASSEADCEYPFWLMAIICAGTAEDPFWLDF